MNIRFDGLLLLIVILGSAVAIPAFAQTTNNTFTPTNTTMSSQGQSQYRGPAYTIANITSSTTTPVVVTTDKPSYNSGDKVTISGTTANYLGDTPLTLEVRSPVGNLVRADQVTVGSDKTFTTSLVAMGTLWQAAGTYVVDVYYGNENATTSFQFSGSSVQSGPSTIQVNVNGQMYSISYTITNGKVLDITADQASKSLMVSIQTTGNGLLTITMPRALIDAKNSDGTDAKFVVLNDGQENTNATETMPAGTTARTLAIPFNNGTQQIEIVGTFVIPEFGPIAIMVLAIAVVSIIAISKKTGLGFSLRY